MTIDSATVPVLSTNSSMPISIDLAERGWLPDLIIRQGIRRLLAARIRSELHAGCEGLSERHRELLKELRSSPIALHVQDANAQHYEVPAAYFELVLGPRLKYSSCLWPEGVSDLAEAETAMLRLTCERARIQDGMEILELGCGWGSLTLFMAETFPRSRVLAVSNSSSQREFILSRAAARGLTNIDVQTCDMNDFNTPRRFDRVVSIEMFEHMRNYETLFGRIAGWLKATGMLFTHVFYHGRCAYTFETDGRNDWMARHFFTGGTMPSADLFLEFQRDLLIADRWLINGRHYQKTLEAWLIRHDAARAQILPLFEATYGREEASRMLQRWRMFYMACSELFGYSHGEEWGVAHYLFQKREAAR